MRVNRRCLNRMVGAKVSIVTHKVQTTRARIRGVAMSRRGSQIVFRRYARACFRPRRRLDRAMVAAAWGGASDADVVVLLIEAHRGQNDRALSAILDSARPNAPLSRAHRGPGHQQNRQGQGRDVLLALTEPNMNDRPSLRRRRF